MSTPVRIQRKRSKGWKLPANTKCVTRPGPWGNPFKVSPDGDIMKMEVGSAEQAVDLYEGLVARDPKLRELIRTSLRGFNLACYCPLDSPCHGDILLRIANE